MIVIFVCSHCPSIWPISEDLKFNISITLARLAFLNDARSFLLMPFMSITVTIIKFPPRSMCEECV